MWVISLYELVDGKLFPAIGPFESEAVAKEWAKTNYLDEYYCWWATEMHLPEDFPAWAAGFNPSSVYPDGTYPGGYDPNGYDPNGE